MIILGIDPGLAILGYGIIKSEGNKLSTVDYGCVYTEPTSTLPQRLCILYDGISEIIDQYKPDAIGIEELFFSKNVKTGINVAHARGVVVLACQQRCIPLYEYTPKQIKQAVVGYGNAEKAQVQYMVRLLLGLREIPKPDDAADALAAAICLSHTSHNSGGFKIR